MKALRHRLDRWRFRAARADYYDYLAALLDGGAGARTLKAVFADDAHRHGARSLRGRASQHWLASYQQAGGDLYATWDGWFPRGELGLLREAQSLGNEALVRCLGDLAAVLDLLHAAGRLVSGLLWPALAALLLATLAILAVPGFTLPRLLDTFGFVPPDYYGARTRELVAFGAAVRQYAVPGLLVLAGLLAWLAGTLSRPGGGLRRRLDRILWWDVYRNVQALRFLSFLGVALGGEAHEATRLRNALLRQQAGASPWLRAHINTMLARIERGILGPATLDTGLFTPEQFWFLGDMVKARGLRKGLALAARRQSAHILGKVARQAGVLRWLMLLGCVAFILGLVLWHYAVIDELRQSLSLYFAASPGARP